MFNFIVLSTLLTIAAARPGLIHSPLHSDLGFGSYYGTSALDLEPTIHIGTPIVHSLGHSYHHDIPAVSHQSSTIYHGHHHHYPSLIAAQPIYRSYSAWPGYASGLYGGGWNGW